MPIEIMRSRVCTGVRAATRLAPSSRAAVTAVHFPAAPCTSGGHRSWSKGASYRNLIGGGAVCVAAALSVNPVSCAEQPAAAQPKNIDAKELSDMTAEVNLKMEDVVETVIIHRFFCQGNSQGAPFLCIA